MAVTCGDVLLAQSKLPTYTRLVSRSRRTYFDSAALRDKIIEWRNLYGFRWAAVESVHASPQMGVSSSFDFGHTFGLIKGVLDGLGITIRGVEPNVWKPRLGLSSDKNKSLVKAGEIFNAAFNCEATAEAAMIGWFEQTRLHNSTEDVMA